MDNAIIEQKYKYSLVCPNCDVAFGSNTRKKKFCTIACQKYFLRRTETKNCLHCNKEFKTRPEQLFCSKSCRATHKRKMDKEKKSLFNIANTPLPIAYSMPILKEIAALIRIKRRNKFRWFMPKIGKKRKISCAACKNEFVFHVHGGRPPKYCNSCKDIVYKEHEQKNRRIGKSKRRAKIRGLKHEPIDPFFVFERDKWICHICKQKTDKRLRGTHNAKAPELDHIVTIAEGGSHTLENVACSCRSCNNKKRSKSFGQLFLFGG